MSILVDSNTRLLVQGITGREGSFHTTQMVDYGTNVVAGVTPGGKGKDVAGVPVFDTVAEAVAETQPNVSIIYVPARFAPDAIYEAVDNGIPFVICITEGIPVLDMAPVFAWVKSKGARLLVDNLLRAIRHQPTSSVVIPAELVVRASSLREHYRALPSISARRNQPPTAARLRRSRSG